MKRSIVLGAVIAVLGIPPAHAAVNLALGADTSASDDGWGGGTSKTDLVDGFRAYPHWARGLAAPFGQDSFQMTIDFGQVETFDTVVAWWHPAPDRAPDIVDIEAWIGGTWNTVYSTTNALSYLGVEDTSDTYTSHSMWLNFGQVSSDKVRIVYDNAEIFSRASQHGWAYEVEVFNLAGVPEPASCAIWSCLAGIGAVVSRRRKRAMAATRF